MIKGKLVKFQPLKTGGVSVLIDSAKEYMHEMVDLQDAEVIIMPMQENLESDKAALYQRILDRLDDIKKELEWEAR